MNFLSIIFISLGVAMDSFAFAVSRGMTLREPKLKDALFIGFLFGGFQALMPLLGQSLGEYFHEFVASIDHWIAFGILSIIGGKMIHESLQSSSNTERKENLLKPYSLLLVAIATSLDSLIVGITLALVDLPRWLAICSMGLITFFLSFIGVLIGKLANRSLGKYAEAFGGITLIGIGLKTLIQHLYF